MGFKVGADLESMLHESGEDIIISYRTGQKAQIKDGKIVKIYDTKNHQEMNWQLKDWHDQEEEVKRKREEEEAKVQEHARKVASAAAKQHEEAAAKKKKQKAAAQ